MFSKDSKRYESDFPSERYSGSTVYLTPDKDTDDGICHRGLCVRKNLIGADEYGNRKHVFVFQG